MRMRVFVVDGAFADVSNVGRSLMVVWRRVGSMSLSDNSIHLSGI